MGPRPFGVAAIVWPRRPPSPPADMAAGLGGRKHLSRAVAIEAPAESSHFRLFVRCFAA